MTDDPSELQVDIAYDTLAPVCRPGVHCGLTVLLAAEQGRIRVMTAGARHVNARYLLARSH